MQHQCHQAGVAQSCDKFECKLQLMTCPVDACLICTAGCFVLGVQSLLGLQVLPHSLCCGPFSWLQKQNACVLLLSRCLTATILAFSAKLSIRPPQSSKSCETKPLFLTRRSTVSQHMHLWWHGSTAVCHKWSLCGCMINDRVMGYQPRNKNFCLQIKQQIVSALPCFCGVIMEKGQVNSATLVWLPASSEA